MKIKMLLHIWTIGLLLLILSSCQNPTQPTDLTAQRTMTLELRSTSNAPISGATVDWSKLTGANAPIGARVTTGGDGYAQWIIPEVSTQRDSVRLILNVPASAPTGALGPITFTTSVCNDTMISLAFAPPTPCGNLDGRDTISLETCPQGGNASARKCSFFVSSCPDELIYTAPDSSVGAISIDLQSFNSGGSAVVVCATFAPSATASIGTREEFVFRIEGRAANSSAIAVAYNLVIIGRVTCLPCPCPTIPIAKYTMAPVCIGNTSTVRVPLDLIAVPISSGPGCVTEFTLETKPDAVLIVSSGDRFTLRSDQLFPPINLTITPSVGGKLERTLEWSVRTRNLTTGVVEQCPTRFSLQLTTDVLSPSCVVNISPIDTLQKCVFADTSTVDTFSITNDGDCPITVLVTSNSGLFQVFPRGSITIGPRMKQLIRIGFSASKTDWDRNSMTPVVGRGSKFFTGTISVTGCGPRVDIPVVGDAYIQCNAFKYQCLRQFRPPSFPNVYAESIQLVENRTNIIYQNDNQNFAQYDIFVKSLTANGPSFDLELGSGGNGGNFYGVFRRISSGFSVNPGENICDKFPASAQMECTGTKNDITRGTTSLGGLSAGDVVLYTKIGSTGLQCALIWIQSIGLDRPGPNALPQACIKICYPMFAL